MAAGAHAGTCLHLLKAAATPQKIGAGWVFKTAAVNLPPLRLDSFMSDIPNRPMRSSVHVSLPNLERCIENTTVYFSVLPLFCPYCFYISTQPTLYVMYGFDILTPCRLVNSDVAGERPSSNISVYKCMKIIIINAVADFITVFSSQP